MENKVNAIESQRMWGTINSLAVDYEEAMDAFEQSGLIPTDGQFYSEIIVNESDTLKEDHNDESSKTVLPKRVLAFTATHLLELFE